MTHGKRIIAALLSAACLLATCAAQAEDVNRLIEPTRRLRMKLLADPYRPTYHIVAPEGIHGVFDANGAIFWKGRYHFMYLVCIEKGLCWAHISSIDLVHWRFHPLALTPGGSDKGINSGGISLDKNGVPTIAYWGINSGICIATSTDENLDHWTKSPHNPVIRETQNGLAVVPAADGKGTVIYGVADPTAISDQPRPVLCAHGKQVGSRGIRPEAKDAGVARRQALLVCFRRPGPLEIPPPLL